MKKREIISKQKLTESINKVNDRTPMVFYLTMFIFVVSCVTGAILMALYTLLNELGVIGELNLYLVILLFCFNFRISRRIYHLDQCPQNRSFTHRVVFPLRTVIIK